MPDHDVNDARENQDSQPDLGVGLSGKGPSTFRTRIFRSIVPIFLILFCLLGAINFYQQSQLVRQQFLKRGQVMARNLAYSQELGVFAEDEQLLEPAIRGVEADADFAYVFIYSQDEKLLTKAGKTDALGVWQSLELSDQEKANLLDRREPIWRHAVGARGRFVEFVAPVLSVADTIVEDQLVNLLDPTSPAAANSGEAMAIGHVRLGLSLAVLRQNTSSFVKLWFGLTAAFLVLSTTAMYVLSRRITEPIKRLTGHADRIAHGELDQVIPVESRDEIGQLAASFNNMAHALKWNIKKKSQLLDELKDLNRTLEERISQRTTQLEERTEALEIASRHKSEFLAKMSHELRTPLNAVIGYSEMLEEEAEDLGVTQIIPDLRKIHSSGKHLLGLINDVLDLAKIEAGKIEIFLEPFDVHSMAQEVASTIEPLVEKNANTLRISCADGVGQMHSDLTRVRQCLFNLLSNACKFTENGTICLDVTHQSENGQGWILLRVSDSGIGMTGEQVGKVFEAFQQAEAATSRKYGGTGLGLAISRQFCQMLGGDISVESELGKGSAFTIRLPADGSTVSKVSGSPLDQADAGSGPPSPGGEPRLDGVDRLALVVDDDKSARDLMRRHLQKEGFEVIECSTASEALGIAKARHPSVITLDVIMPGMDGWAVLKALKDDPDTQEIPVVMTSMVNDQSMGFALGASEYLTKPVDRKRLSGVLKKYRCRYPQECPHETRPVLVVEDDATARQMLRRMLEKEGWSVIEAENGKVGLDRMAESQPSLIFLDLMMPEMDGFEFVRQMHQTEAWRQIPVIVLTAKDITEQDRQQLNGYVQQMWQKGGYAHKDLLSQLPGLIASGVRQGGDQKCLVCKKEPSLAGGQVDGSASPLDQKQAPELGG